MTVSIRAKIVALLATVAALPLVAALIAIVVLGGRMRMASFRDTLMARARGETRQLQLDLVRDVEKMLLALQQPAVVNMLQSRVDRLDEAELARRDELWQSLARSDPMLLSVLRNPTADALRGVRQIDPRIGEVLMTDRFGQLVAATGRTSDYYQADEYWWQRVWAGGQGRVYISPGEYDPSAGLWSVSLCLPIHHEGELLGVAKAVMSLSELLGLDARVSAQEMSEIMLVAGDGRILYRQGVEPLSTRVADWDKLQDAQRSEGYRITDGGECQAYVPFSLPDQIGLHEVISPSWYYMLYVPRSRPLEVIYRLGGTILSIGLVIIAIVFLGGLLLVDRSLARRIRMLAHATHEVTRGDLAHRIPGPDPRYRWLGSDEIDELAEDFNRMVQQVQTSHDELAEANALKDRFIQVAGHELRTPIAYILAAAKILRECDDPRRLRDRLESLSGKAERLNQILQQMFKVMPEREGLQVMDYESVDLSALLEEIRGDCVPFLQRREQSMAVEVAPDVPEIHADRDKLWDIVMNLVLNAIKFSPDGATVHVDVSREPGGETPDSAERPRVAIAVRDSGPGIAPDELPHLFKPFYTGGDVMQHSTGTAGHQKRGLGLGLAIVHQFVEYHEGEVRVDSGEDGTTFTVLLPVASSE